MVLSALVQMLLPSGATRTRSDNAVWRCHPHSLWRSDLRASKRCCPHVSWNNAVHSRVDLVPAVQPARAWRCHPDAPPISMQLRQCSPHVPRTMPRMRPTLPRWQAFLSSFGTAPRRCSDGVSHASDVASPASVLQALVVGPLWHCCDRSVRQSSRLHRHPGVWWRIEAVRRASPASFIARRFERRQRHSTLMLLRCYPPTSLVWADEGISVISIITAEFQSPLSSLPLLEASLISDARSIMRDQCAWSRRHAHHMHSRTHTSHCVRRQEWRNTDCVVVTMALVSDFSHPERIILLKAILTDSVNGKSLLVELFQRHLATCIIRSPLLHHHDWSLLLCHCIRRNLLHPLRGSHGVFLSDLFWVRHANAFLCPSFWRCCICLSHIVSDSDVCASVSVSCSRSCPLTSAGFCSCGVPPGSILRSSGLATFSICFPSHISHIALLPEVVLASAPVPICSKIWEVCFDVNTVLDDSPINSGGATRSRHCSLFGGATRARSDADSCVLPNDATWTRHDDAFSSKRLTVPCDSDFLCVSLICDGLASQHACPPTVLNTISLVSSSAFQGVFWHAHRVFESAWCLNSQVSNCIDDFIAGELVPAASLDARTSCCISVSSMSRRLPVAFVTSVGVSFDSSFTPCRHASPDNTCCAVSFLLDVHKFIDSSHTHLLWFKQMSKISTLGSTALLVPVHNLLSPSITLFGNCQNDRSTRIHVHNGSVPIEYACQQFVAFNVELVLSFHLPNPWTRRWLCRCIYRNCSQPHLAQRWLRVDPRRTTVTSWALHGALLNLFGGFLYETFELALILCLYNFIVHDILCSCCQNPADLIQLAARHAFLLTSTLDQMFQGNALPVLDL